MIMIVGEFCGHQAEIRLHHAVALHNCTATETLHYADSLNLDRDVVYVPLSKSAGQSKMLDLRKPLIPGCAFGGYG